MMKISEMPKYDDYVDSGVEWLGRVPASWELTRLGTRFNERRSIFAWANIVIELASAFLKRL